MAGLDVFNRAGSYEPYVGRWSRRLAPVFVEWLGVEPGSRWLDVGCGTGALTDAILATAEPRAVSGVDPSAGFIAHAQAAITDARAGFQVGNAMQLPFGGGEFDAAAAALVLNFVPEPRVAIAEMRRVVRAGGRVGAYVWDYAVGMRMMRVFWDAAVELDPAAASHDEGKRSSICNPPALRAGFEGAGLQDVDVVPLDCEMAFTGFDDYWTPFLGGQAPAPAYAMSLDEASRLRLRELIRSRLAIEPDGTIRMVSRAWAVRGTVA